MSKKQNKDQILQALAGLLPEDVQKEALAAIETFVENTHNELKDEYNKKLEEAYKIVAKEKDDVKKVAEEGYSQAYQMITDLRDRLEVQKEEFKQELEKGYEEAYQEILTLKKENQDITSAMYEDYDRRVKEVSDFFIDKIDEFLTEKGDEFYEQARKDVASDPLTAEHKVALEKILEVASTYLSEEELQFATSKKVDELSRELEEIRGQNKVFEAKAFRLATENNRLNEQVRQNAQLLSEATQVEQKERLKKARNAEGRGNKVEKERVAVITEHQNPNHKAPESNDDDDTRFVESVDGEITDQWQFLAGLSKRD